MKKNSKQILMFVLLLLVSMATHSAEIGSIDGIWQDESRQTDYYSIHQDGVQIAVIDLNRLEASRSAFAATYIGPISDSNDSLLTPLGAFPEYPFDKTPRSLTFTSDTEAILKYESDCDVCSTIAAPLRKVFK